MRSPLAWWRWNIGTALIVSAMFQTLLVRPANSWLDQGDDPDECQLSSATPEPRAGDPISPALPPPTITLHAHVAPNTFYQPFLIAGPTVERICLYSHPLRGPPVAP